MNRKTKAKILLGAFIVSGTLSQMSSISPLYAMVTDDDDAAATATTASSAHSESPQRGLAEEDLSDKDRPLYIRILCNIYDQNIEKLSSTIAQLPDDKRLYLLSTRTNSSSVWDTPITLATRNGFTEGVQYLCSLDGVEIDAPDCNGYTALSIAIQEGNHELEKFLREHGATLGSTDQLLHCGRPIRPGVITTNDTLEDLSGEDLVLFLGIQDSIYGRDVTRLNRILTPLAPGRQRLLLNALENGFGLLHIFVHRTPVDFELDREIVTYLLDNPNIDVNSQDPIGQTPLSLAERYGNTELAQLLRSRGAITTAAKHKGDMLHSLKKFFAHPMDQNDM